jgi:hypothetical protein
VTDDADDPGTTELPPIDTDNPDVIATARRKYGGAGVLLAAGMFGLDKVLNDKKKTESVQVQEASSEPVDVDASGITVDIDASTSVHSPALEPKPPVVGSKKKPRR